MLNLYAIVAAVGYLLGSIPFGFLLVKFLRGEDVRRIGSGNIGATNVARSGAKGLGIATLILDTLKGVVAVLFAGWLATRNGLCGAANSCTPILQVESVAALAAVLGHMFPVWLRFKGGKGVATALGVFLVLFPKAVLVSLVIFIICVVVTRYVSLGSILGSLAFPAAAWAFGVRDWQSLLPACVISLLVVIKHHQNIGRLVQGNENKLGGSKPATTEKQA
ncbi:MAG TPA: glycerol-3-phosphate 1-O-acyltransferase PlsY [Candidatus Angelobacter sp.]|jgi:glycerol-3-phosphate acyltransferase PlsY|nr:glycerol-3-phosphate 1-O-acyltransferase PlsY [Candidatus Angelobacter sp.]